MNFRLPAEIHNIQNDEKQVQQQINTNIENLYGTKGILYAPFMAFETVVRMQILQLEKPIMTCVDLVVEELSNAVRNCTQRVSHCVKLQSQNHQNETILKAFLFRLNTQISSYPTFRDNIENYIMTFIHKNRLQFQTNVLSLIKMEASYMNTRHEDFIYDWFVVSQFIT